MPLTISPWIAVLINEDGAARVFAESAEGTRLNYGEFQRAVKGRKKELDPSGALRLEILTAPLARELYPDSMKLWDGKRS